MSYHDEYWNVKNNRMELFYIIDKQWFEFKPWNDNDILAQFTQAVIEFWKQSV